MHGGRPVAHGDQADGSFFQSMLLQAQESCRFRSPISLVNLTSKVNTAAFVSASSPDTPTTTRLVMASSEATRLTFSFRAALSSFRAASAGLSQETKGLGFRV